MLTLAIDTSSALLSIALLKGKTIIATHDEESQRGQAEFLIPKIMDMLQNNGFSLKQMNAVAVGVGPGSFTGIRVGLATARGLGLALNIPVWGVTSFEAAIYGIPTPVVAVLDTKRDDYYTAFVDETGKIKPEPSIQTAEELKIHLPFNAAGDGADKLATEIGCTALHSLYSKAAAIGLIAF